MIISDLSPAQERALNRLLTFGGGWVNTVRLQESISTLDSLVRKGYAQRKTGDYAIPFPRATLYYRAHPNLIKIIGRSK